MGNDPAAKLVMFRSEVFPARLTGKAEANPAVLKIPNSTPNILVAKVHGRVVILPAGQARDP